MNSARKTCLLCEKPLATADDDLSENNRLALHSLDCPRIGQERQIIAELRAIVGRLPKTEDGVPIVPGMSVWSRPGHVRGKSAMEHYGAIRIDSYGDAIIGVVNDWDGMIVDIRECYSTQAAAEAAAKGGDHA